MTKTAENSIKEKIMGALDNIENRYPEDLFPKDGTSLDCAGARFVRNIIGQLRAELFTILSTRTHYTPKELAEKYQLTPSGIYKRLHHRNCPQTERHLGPTERLLSVEVTEELDRFLGQPNDKFTLLR